MARLALRLEGRAHESLVIGPAGYISGGDSFRIVAGCNKQFSTCRAKFANTPNFRGFPHVPGNDFMLSVASRTDRNDGKKLNR